MKGVSINGTIQLLTGCLHGSNQLLGLNFKIEDLQDYAPILMKVSCENWIFISREIDCMTGVGFRVILTVNSLLTTFILKEDSTLAKEELMFENNPIRDKGRYW
jgi:hypothetical protein